MRIVENCQNMVYDLSKCGVLEWFVREEKKMIKVADCLIEDYIHSSKLKNFCSMHSMPVSENKPELVKRIIEYAGDDAASSMYKEVYAWIIETIKAGSKELCMKRIYIPDDILENVSQIIANKYPDYSPQDILSFHNTNQFKLVNYQVKEDEEGLVSHISFLFSRLVLEGDKEFEKGHKIIYPIYIDIYVAEGFIVARYKPKTTIYSYAETDIIYKDNRFKPFEEAIKLIENIGRFLKIEDLDINPKQKFGKMMYKLYQKFSFVPNDIQIKIDAMKNKRNQFIDDIFRSLDLKEVNKTKAKLDLDIFLEKYISINGNMEKVFKEDREAYLIKITSDDILQMTRIDTASTGNRPLQCSDTFFDGKKSILNTKECKVLHLCYNRKRGYLGSFTVQLSLTKGWGIAKMYYVPEEEDIQNVLQTIFENY